MMRGPTLIFLALFLKRALPEFFLTTLHLSTSGLALSLVKSARAFLVLVRVSTASVATTKGISGIAEIWCPRAKTSAGTVEAAKAEATAYLFWLIFTLRCHLLQVRVGANILPPRHMLPKAPCPARCVPPPGTLGIRATALPVPQEAADVCVPAHFATE